jgi:hypothetical protein
VTRTGSRWARPPETGHENRLDHRKPETTIGSTTGSRFVSGKNLVSTIMFHVKHGG